MIINKVEICGVNTSKLSVLSAEEKELLLKKIKEGDNDARNKFVYGNLRLVLSVIQRFKGRGEMIDDLFQVGCIGLMKAIDNFDLNQNVQFSTYAVPMIIGEIRRYLRDNNAIRVSRSIRDTAYKALQIKEMLFNKNSKEPTVKEIADEMGVPCEDIVIAFDAIQDTVSLFDPVYQEGNDTLCVMDQVKDVDCCSEMWDQTITLDNAVNKLNEREKMIIKLRFYDGLTQMEIAEEIGISQAQVSRLDGSRIGYVCDIGVDLYEGKIDSVIVGKTGRLNGKRSVDTELVIPFSKIMRIGDDLIIVDIDEKYLR